MTAVGDAERSPDPEAALGEVQAVAHAPADAVVITPLHPRRVDAALQHQVLDKSADVIVGEGGDDRGALAEAAPQAARNVVLAAALPYVERARRADAPVSWIEPQHHLTQRDEVVAALVALAQTKRTHAAT